jgi:hypothetical protein
MIVAICVATIVSLGVVIFGYFNFLGDNPGIPTAPEFVDHVGRPESSAIFEQTVDGVTAEAYDVGDCGILIITVPDIGEFAEEQCDPGGGVGGWTCALVENEQCLRAIPPFFLIGTMKEAAAVCIQVGNTGEVIAARAGWWLHQFDGSHGDVYPLDEAGNRIDDPSVDEIDDRIAEDCGLR